MITENGETGGIQLANTQTFSHLEKTAAVIVNKTIPECRRLLLPPHKITTLNMLMIYTPAASELTV